MATGALRPRPTASSPRPTPPRRFGRGLAGAVEASWSGAPDTLPWTLALEPAAAVYERIAARARRRAAESRATVPGLEVIAVGNLTVGGTGKSSLARWIASRAMRHGRVAVLLRGHGSRATDDPVAVPDFPGYPLARAAVVCGDEAAAHRAALPPQVAVIAGRDRHRAAQLAREGYGARLVVMDDGWEQGTLAWNALWVALDPLRPAGNGRELPAGPLRRPAPTLRDASVLAWVLESEAEEVPDATVAWARRFAPIACAARFRRELTGLAPPGAPGAFAGAPLAPAEVAARGPVLLLTGVGAPGRVERFLQGAGIDVAAHAAFPDHAPVPEERLREVIRTAARRGARAALVTEKDEHRWSLPREAAIPVLALRTGLVPLDPVDRLPGIAPGPVRTDCGGARVPDAAASAAT